MEKENRIAENASGSSLAGEKVANDILDENFEDIAVDDDDQDLQPLTTAPTPGDVKEKDLLMDEDEDAEVDDNNPIEALKRAWINERGAPEILEYEASLVQRIKQELETQQDLLDQIEEQKGNSLMKRMYQMEMERINFLLKSYLRTRLKKIEKYVLKILSEDDLVRRLSNPEATLAAKYLDLQEAQFNSTFLRHIPDQYRKLDDKEMIPEPNLEEYVFCRASADAGTVNLGESGDADIIQGDILVASYKHLKDLLTNGLVSLI